MIPGLPIQPVPDWLDNAAPPLGNLPFDELLPNSVFYPASGVDGRPVQWLAGNFLSFVYVDFALTQEEVLDALNGNEVDFDGYHPVACRCFGPTELPLLNGIMADPAANNNWPQQILAEPFAIWAIMGRLPQFGPDHGPERFSLLHFGGDAENTFVSLYTANNTAPAVVSIIQWSDFEDPLSPLAQAVLSNPAGAPRYLFHGGGGQGGWYHEPCWPAYTEQVWLLPEDGRLRLWRRPLP